MSDLPKSFRDFVESEKLFTKTDKLLLACSGGLDSTVLAHLLHAEGYDFAIAHMNFQLRGEASDGDAAFVEELARTLGARFFLKAVDVKKEALAGESTQMVARRLRYHWFEEFKWNGDYAYVLTAHHLDDSFETFLIQVIRGSNYSGPGPIEPGGGFVRRPLLASARKEVLSYAQHYGIDWREDASNATDDYLRNRVRHHLTPMLRDRFGHTMKNWAKTQEQLLMDARLAQYGKKVLSEKYIRTEGRVITINRAGNGYLAELLREAAAVRGFTPDQRRQMMALKGNATMDSGRWLLTVTPEHFRFEPMEGVMQSILEPETVISLPYINQSVTLELVTRPAELNEAGVRYLAPQNLPLNLRPRQKGDRFQPFGMGGKTKKVKDYMIDEKIPVWLRGRIYLLTNVDNEIMAITGYCISEKFKVLPEHKEVLRITAN